MERCFNYSNHLFFRLYEGKSTERRTKVRIARNLLELTDLPIKDVARIVELPEEVVREISLSVKRNGIKYRIFSEEQAIDRINRQLTELNKENSGK